MTSSWRIFGTIARSGTHAFMETLGQGEGSPKLIGQFGVGFYAAFMVASRVDVISRRAGSDEAWVWSSDGTGTFTVEPYASEDAPKRGTSIHLTLKEDADFLEPWKIEQVVRAYSDHVAIPIKLVSVDQKDAEPRQINNAAALWTRPNKAGRRHGAGRRGDGGDRSGARRLSFRSAPSVPPPLARERGR